MHIKDKRISGIYRAVLSLGGLAGILIQAGVFEGSFDISIFRYYTLLSNVLCCLYFAAAAAADFCNKETPLPWFKSALTMGITVTGLVYHFMLSGQGFSMGGSMAVANFILHYAVPVLAVLDWLLFDKKGRYTWRAPISWVILPDIYFVLATIYGFSGGRPFYGGGRFPYFFIDFDALGTAKVFMYVIVLNVLFAGLGYVFYFIDRMAGRKKLAA